MSWPANVSILGPISKVEMAREFAAADLFLLPSFIEGSATVTYEAMGWGLPIVTTPQAGSVARDRIDGFICDPYDIDAIACAIVQLKDRELRSMMGIQGRQRIDEGYSLAGYGARLIRVLQGLEANANEQAAI